MNDKKIKVCFLHPDVRNVNDMLTWLHLKSLPFAENIVFDNENPDYIFATDHIYHNLEYAKTFMRLAQKASIRIYFSGESITPDLNIFDYAIAFDKKLSDMDRITSMPANIFWTNLITRTENELTSQEEAKSLLQERKRFCNFIYSNRGAHPNRDKLFHTISAYKHVDSLGRHLNNIGALITYKKGGISWSELSRMIKSKYKFSIASENARYEGYTSEKLLTSFEAHTVPIYWGNPYVAEEFNSEAFVNCMDYESFDEVVKRVKEIDEDDDLWAYMVSRQWQTNEQKKSSEQLLVRYLRFMENIFTQPVTLAKRRPEGTFTRIYERWFFQRKYYNPSRLSMIFTAPSVLLSRLKNKFTYKREIDIHDFFKD
mgnify:CR=1 FL=1